MIELAQHIEALLLENDCVIVPGFGGFIAHYAPATRSREENLFLPPTRTIGFNPQLKLNDGVLVQSYMNTHETSFSDASRRIEKQVNELISLLHEDGKAHLGNIGEIHYNIHGRYEFVPYNHKITTPAFYGLDSFEMRELAALRQPKEKVLIPAVLEKEKKTYDIRINRAFLRNAVAVVAAVVLFFTFSTPVENTDVRKNNYAQLLPGELFEQIEKQSVAMTPVCMTEVQSPQKRKKAAQGQPMMQTSRPVKVKEVRVAPKTTTPSATATSSASAQTATTTAPAVQKKAAAPATAAPAANMPFHIIVAGGISMKDAEAIAGQLQAKGYSGARALNTDGKVRVSIRSFANRNEATQFLLNLRKEENYQNAWLLAK